MSDFLKFYNEGKDLGQKEGRSFAMSDVFDRVFAILKEEKDARVRSILQDICQYTLDERDKIKF